MFSALTIRREPAGSGGTAAGSLGAKAGTLRSISFRISLDLPGMSADEIDVTIQNNVGSGRSVES